MLTEISEQGLEAGIRVGQTPVGLGLFASQPFGDGEIVGNVDGVFFHGPSGHDSEYCIGLDAITALEPAPPFAYLNHSCNPNCAVYFDCQDSADGDTFGHQVWIETLRPVEPGEELTIDYAWPADSAIPCKCGSANCRGWVCCEDELDRLPQ